MAGGLKLRYEGVFGSLESQVPCISQKRTMRDLHQIGFNQTAFECDKSCPNLKRKAGQSFVQETPQEDARDLVDAFYDTDSLSLLFASAAEPH